VRKQRNRALRELAAVKNLEFRRRMVGRMLSAVTLHEPGVALTTNFLKVELSPWPAPNLMVDCLIDGVTCAGLAGQVVDLQPPAGAWRTANNDGLTRPESVLG
jgi:threonylcarbamoyladenosine tRNA methylthiotransferase MtaB